MGRFDRIYKIHDLLRNARKPVPMRVFTETLEASRNTVTRDFEYLRDSLGAPLEYCREYKSHCYDLDAPVFELPGFCGRQATMTRKSASAYELRWCNSVTNISLFKERK